jgi:hypothetical protein
MALRLLIEDQIPAFKTLARKKALPVGFGLPYPAINSY